MNVDGLVSRRIVCYLLRGDSQTLTQFPPDRRVWQEDRPCPVFPFRYEEVLTDKSRQFSTPPRAVACTEILAPSYPSTYSRSRSRRPATVYTNQSYQPDLRRRGQRGIACGGNWKRDPERGGRPARRSRKTNLTTLVPSFMM